MFSDAVRSAIVRPTLSYTQTFSQRAVRFPSKF